MKKVLIPITIIGIIVSFIFILFSKTPNTITLSDYLNSEY